MSTRHSSLDPIPEPRVRLPAFMILSVARICRFFHISAIWLDQESAAKIGDTMQVLNFTKSN